MAKKKITTENTIKAINKNVSAIIVSPNNSSSCSTILKLSKKANQLITLQWWQGYSESLIDFKSERGMIRAGVILKPTFLEKFKKFKCVLNFFSSISPIL